MPQPWTRVLARPRLGVAMSRCRDVVAWRLGGWCCATRPGGAVDSELERDVSRAAAG